MGDKYTEINSRTWDVWAENGCDWSLPVTHEEFEAVTEENWGVYLTPCITVPHEWFGELKGKKLLGLASGGGQQMPIFTRLGRNAPFWIIRTDSWRPKERWRAGKDMPFPLSKGI